MIKKIIFTISFVIISICGNAQKNINDYKYIIIPNSFEFSNSDDQYQLNSLTEFLFNKYGYEAYLIDDVPEEIKSDRCLALTADVSNEEKTMFKTKVEVILKDCYGEVVMKSKIGESRLKEYPKAYNQALRGAFETFKKINYKYVAKEEVVETLKEEKPTVMKVAKQKETTEENTKVAVSKIEVNDEEAEDVVSSINETTSELYYAQAITNGFQLVNSEPKVVMVLLTTYAKDVFLVKDKNAIVFNKDGQWVYSQNEGTSLEVRVLDIKF
ncbi:hypothetical protein H7F37_08470 [Winogradskyella sp. PAMC22761]|nr:hypothetical protein H7F37_08470 [Winogradskyella sp. PAMC22761]